MEKTTVKVFIASSAEVKEERDKCILILNQINNSRPHLDLKVVEWEYNMVYGSYPDFASAQDAINPLLKDSHLCLFIFYSKIGKFTREEFELASELKMKIIPFFKEGFSPKAKDARIQWDDLMTFKESLNGIIIPLDYSNFDKFESLFTHNLHLFLSEKFPPLSSSENKPLSNETSTLLKILTEKQEEIDQLKKGGLSLPDAESKKQLALLEKERDDLRNELQQNKEIQEQQAKEKQELELRLAPQVAKDNLKQKALAAIQESNYDEAKTLLKESAKESISDAASTFYELGKVSKLQLLYKEALYYFELAASIKPGDFDMNMEAGKMLRDAGYNDRAITLFENALKILEPGSSQDETNLSYLYNELGSAYDNKGEYDKAIEFYTQALSLDKKIYGEEHSDIAVDYNNIGIAYNNKGEYDKAIKYYTQALAISKKFYGEEHPKIAICYNNIGAAFNDKGEYDKAIEYFTKALLIDKKFHGEEHPEIAIRYNNIGEAYRNKGEYDKAIEYYTKALAIGKKFYGEEHPQIATFYNNIGLAYNSKGEYNEAIKDYERCLNILRKVHSDGHPYIDICTRSLEAARKALANSEK